MKNVTKTFVDNVEKEMRRVPDPSFDTAIELNKLKQTVGEEEEETTEATSSGAAGQYSAPLFSGEEPEKVEATEATSTSSSGSYVTPQWVAPNKKNWRGAQKPQIPGGKFVQIKKKCSTFPYCNQGDIKALKIYENQMVKESISNLSKKMGVNENVIKAIIQHELEERRNKSNS
jgi:hypothetical protein